MRRLAWTCAALCWTSAPVGADFVGVKLENVTDQFVSDEPDAQGFSTANTVIYELYANFSNANDTLQNVFHVNVEAENNLFYHALNFDGEKQSTPLTKSEYDALGSEVDTFVTVGFKYGGKNGNPGNVKNPIALDPSFIFNEETFLSGGVMGPNVSWFTNPPTTIASKAGTYGDFKILLARFAFTPTPDDPYIACAPLGGSLRLTVKNQGLVTVQTGVLEFFVEGTLSGCNACPGDYNHDEVVDGADLGVLLGFWGTYPPTEPAPGDLNFDNNVDGADLGILLAAWGPCVT